MTCFVAGCGGHVRDGVCQKCGTPQNVRLRNAKPVSKPKGKDKPTGDKKTTPGSGKK